MSQDLCFVHFKLLSKDDEQMWELNIPMVNN
jgi:hypothetical protein